MHCLRKIFTAVDISILICVGVGILADIQYKCVPLCPPKNGIKIRAL